MENKQKPAPSESRIQMPGALGFEVTLAARESKTVLLPIPPDYDFVLHRVTCRSDGPVMLKTEVVQPLDPVAQNPGLPNRSRRPLRLNTPVTSRPS